MEKLKNFTHGMHIERGVFNPNEIEKLRAAFYKTLSICTGIRNQLGVENGMENTVHHVLFMDDIFQELLEKDQNKKVLADFFDNKKYILNSLGGQNNIKVNYARKIHRDVRFYSSEKLMLNAIWCVSPLNERTGATQFMLGSHLKANEPKKDEFESNMITIKAGPGDIVYFDSRVWHRAGSPVEGITERIIYTPIFSRPFIKSGFNYSSACQSMNSEATSEYIKQLSSYFSDVPNSHEDWYNFPKRKFYMKDQDI